MRNPTRLQLHGHLVTGRPGAIATGRYRLRLNLRNLHIRPGTAVSNGGFGVIRPALLGASADEQTIRQWVGQVGHRTWVGGDDVDVAVDDLGRDDLTLAGGNGAEHARPRPALLVIEDAVGEAEEGRGLGWRNPPLGALAMVSRGVSRAQHQDVGCLGPHRSALQVQVRGRHGVMTQVGEAQD